MRKFKGVMITAMLAQDKVWFGNLIPRKSSSIEHTELAEMSTIDRFMPLIRACKNLHSRV